MSYITYITVIKKKKKKRLLYRALIYYIINKNNIKKKITYFFPQLLRRVIFFIINVEMENWKTPARKNIYIWNIKGFSFSSLPTKSLSGSTFTDPTNRPLCILIRYFSRFLFPFSGEPHFQIGRDNRPVSYAKTQPWYCYCS